MSQTRIIAGAMSGTSADGVDVALVEVVGRGLAMTAKPLAHAYEPFTPDLRAKILAVRQAGGCSFAELAQIGREVTLAHVPAFRAALENANLKASDIEAIAAHGQTVFHAPPNTIQYFDPALLAAETGVQVVSDFRRADLAVGGQGAPLVPFADWILFRHPTKSRVILNIGGIANITYLKAGGSIEDVIAFDTGPGNCISDWLMREQGGVDVDGALARRGRFSGPVLDVFLADPFFRRPAPKSTDGPAMVGSFERSMLTSTSGLSIEDALATAAQAVAQSIVVAISLFPAVDEVFVAGGGVRNAAMMNCLSKRFDDRQIAISVARPWADGVERSVDFPSAREAIAFALLGAATLDGEPSNVPSATGASRRVVLGSITPRP